jgi:glycosyltransferase involved in cell wall biosynthesis
MNKAPAISICIPAYKNQAYVKRLLDSVAAQQFRDFEVVITDDSPDNELRELAETFRASFPVLYHKNEQPLGSPANWNKAIALASGAWIKIMHDDDWFATEQSLGFFYEATLSSNANFIFSGFINQELDTGQQHPFVISAMDEQLLRRNPLYLFRTNFIGHPSTTLIRNNRTEWFDEQVKWVVDIEFYMRLLREEHTFFAIKEPLVCIGVGAEQITKQAFRNPAFEIPENLYLLQKLGIGCLKYVFVYDYYWRLVRNLQLKSSAEMEQYLAGSSVPVPVQQMIRLQQKLGQGWLKKSGVYSKVGMGMSYLAHRLRN